MRLPSTGYDNVHTITLLNSTSVGLIKAEAETTMKPLLYILFTILPMYWLLIYKVMVFPRAKTAIWLD